MNLIEVEQVAEFIFRDFIQSGGNLKNSCSILSISLHSFLITAAYAGRILQIRGVPVLSCHLRNLFANIVNEEHTYNIFCCGTQDKSYIMTIDLSIGQYRKNPSNKVRDGKEKMSVLPYTAINGVCRLVPREEVSDLNPVNHQKVPGLVLFPDYNLSKDSDPQYRKFIYKAKWITKKGEKITLHPLLKSIFVNCIEKWKLN